MLDLFIISFPWSAIIIIQFSIICLVFPYCASPPFLLLGLFLAASLLWARGRSTCFASFLLNASRLFLYQPFPTLLMCFIFRPGLHALFLCSSPFKQFESFQYLFAWPVSPIWASSHNIITVFVIRFLIFLVFLLVVICFWYNASFPIPILISLWHLTSIISSNYGFR